MIEALKLLHELSDTLTIDCGPFTVRHLYKDEPLPQFGHGIPTSPLQQNEWIWIAEMYNDPVGILVACPMQGIAFLMRIYAIKGAPKSILVGLFRKALADIYSRGYTSYATYLDESRPEEASLIRIARRAGATVVNSKHVAVGGPTDIRKW